MTAAATTIDLGTGVASVLGCPKVNTIGLVGQTPSTWASDAILLISASLKTDSDGYQFTMLLSDTGFGAAAANAVAGGCVYTTGNYVCL